MMPSSIETLPSPKLMPPGRGVPARGSEPADGFSFNDELERVQSQQPSKPEPRHEKRAAKPSPSDSPSDEVSDCTEGPVTEVEKFDAVPGLPLDEADATDEPSPVETQSHNEPVDNPDFDTTLVAEFAPAVPFAGQPIVAPVDQATESFGSSQEIAAINSSPPAVANPPASVLPSLETTEQSPEVGQIDLPPELLDAGMADEQSTHQVSPQRDRVAPSEELATATAGESPDPIKANEPVARQSKATEPATATNTIPEEPVDSVKAPDHVKTVAGQSEPSPVTFGGTGPLPQEVRHTQPSSLATPAQSPSATQFFNDNQEPIVTGIRTQLLPTGGSMQLRLDPPELGALQVMVSIRDGVMTASFQTSNDDATRLLSHSLSQLKSSLESQGISIDKLHVQQTPRDQQPTNDDGARQQQSQSWQDGQSARQEQQRRELLQRMWRRLTEGSDPLDMFA
jgi:flagellar hook-length control protein FliK